VKRLVLLLLAACGGSSPGDETCAIDGPMCKHLSSWNLFDDIASQKPAAGVIPYDLNTPLFSDYATKDRFIRLPDGASATWNDNDAFEFPVGTLIIKTFSYPSERLETRVLIHGATGWHGGSYVYGDATDDAVLAIAGAQIQTQDPANNYFVPNQNQCKNCHAEHSDIVTPIGPKARNVQPDHLQAFIDAGALTGAPPREMWPHAVNAFDATTGSLDERARAWLDINCSYCHNPTGAARTSGLYLDRAQTDAAKWGLCKAPVATGRGSGGLTYDIVPGQPDASILVYRINSTEPEIRMPELGRNLIHAEGLALIREWIAAMPGDCTSQRTLP
jgi:uncharacterized repeat protein (TIGR03806 family)